MMPEKTGKIESNSKNYFINVRNLLECLTGCIMDSYTKFGTMRYFLSLGCNLGNRKNNLERAIELLSKAGLHIISTSSVYETEPVGIGTESWFYNQVLEVETGLVPEELLLQVKRIEKQMGRVYQKSLSSRPIDIDILLAGEETMNTESLQIPHSRMTERNFVLYPLAEIAPEVIHPILNEKILDLLEKSEDRFIVKKL